MITELLLLPIFALIKLVGNLIPVINIDLSFLNGITYIIEFLQTVSYFVPVGTVFTAIIILIAVDSFNSIVWLLNFVIKKIPTI